LFKIQTLNRIADVIYEVLSQDRYIIGSDMDNPDALIVRSASLHSMEFPQNLIAIARAGAGVNNIPIDRCSQAGIAVFNTPGANANAVKEMVICALILASRNVIQSIEWTRTLKGKGSEVPKLVEKGKGQFVGPEIKGKKLGVIGLGAIGVLVANAASSLGMKVMGYDKYMSVESAWQLSRAVRRATEDQVIRECDYITFHTPLTDETRGRINKDLIASMKRGATILNFSRAELAVTEDVIEALESGQLSHYVVDFPTDDMIGVPNAICLPHLASGTPESEENCASMAAEQLADYIENGNIKNSVNLPDCNMPRSGVERIAVIHRNVPNTISRITASLADRSINIANMISNSKKEYSYTLMDIDESVDESLIEKIEQMDGIIRVRLIR
jgi:D-3-phosphoglycerate dehydrogenase